jgi:copper chaperone
MQHNFTVTGMTCGHCEKAVSRAITALDPQAKVQVDRVRNQVKVQSTLPQEVLVQAIVEEGYGVEK